MFLQQACECRVNNPWGAFIGGDKSKTYGHECTSVGSGTGDDFCFVDRRSACPDKQMDGGSSKLNFDKESNWYYSYAACKGKPKYTYSNYVVFHICVYIVDILNITNHSFRNLLLSI